MDSQRMKNRNLATVGWSALFIWWGIVVMIDPLTIGMGAIGTGVILLGVNAVRWGKGFPTKGSTTAFGVVALLWGTLDQLRLVFGLPSALSFAMMLIVIGTVLFASELMRIRKAVLGE